MTEPVKRRSANAPTKSDLWGELKATRAELKEVSDKMAKVITENTKALVSLHSLVTNLGEKLTQQTELTESVTRKMTEAMCATQTGVPMRVFVIVVVVLCIIIAAVVGINVTEVGPILGSCGG